MQLKFRSLNADEIDCRVAAIKKDGSGLSLLLYKDARVDQNILDETVGPMNWQRRHTRDNANCIVSLWDEEKKQWIEKEDTGTESNTEAEKGLASDSFKRACFNWGIGRELYTAPFIWITGDQCKIYEKGKGNFACNDRFYVAQIQVTDGKITQLSIGNASRGKIVFTYGSLAPEKSKTENETPKTGEKEPENAISVSDSETKVDPQIIKNIVILAEQTGTNMDLVLAQASVKSLNELSQKTGESLQKYLQRKLAKMKGE